MGKFLVNKVLSKKSYSEKARYIGRYLQSQHLEDWKEKMQKLKAVSEAVLDYMSPCLEKAVNALQKLLASTHLSSSLLTKKFLNIEN